MHSLRKMTNRVKDKKIPFMCANDYICQSSSPKLPTTVDTYVISQSHFLVQLQLEIDIPSTSSTVWLTKAVDIAVS